MTWTIEYYTDAQGNSPIEEFLRGLDSKDEARILHTINLLEEFALRLGTRYVRSLQGKLWELRIPSGRKAYRIIYFAYTGQRFVLLHAFLKKTRKTPSREIRTAQRRYEEYTSRRTE